MKRRATIFGLTAVAATLFVSQLAGLWTAGAQPSRGDPALTGQELADSLGLTPTTANPVVGCDRGTEASGVFYCLDGVTDDWSEFRDLTIRLQGSLPSPRQEKLFAIEEEMNEIHERLGSAAYDDPRYLVLAVQAAELREA